VSESDFLRRLHAPIRLLPRLAPHPGLRLGLPILLYAWTLTGPFVFDDLVLLLKAERFLDGRSDRADLFRFAPDEAAWRTLRSRGTVPWWSEEGRRLDFFRPLAEQAFLLDVRLFGRHAAGHRSMSLAWFILVLVLVHRFLLAVTGDRERSGMAALFFGISQSVTPPVTFISNRSDLLALAGLAAAGLAWASAGRRSAAGSAVGAAAGTVFALLSKEAAVMFAVVLAANAVLRRLDRRETAPVGAGRWAATLSAVVVTAGYLAYYAASRPAMFGLGGESGSPASLREAPLSLALYLSVWTTGFPIGAILHADSSYSLAVGAAGALLGIAAGWHLRHALRSGPAGRFFLLWAVLFLLPGMMTLPEARVLSIATVGWSYLLAMLLAPPAGAARAAPMWLRHVLFTANGLVSIGCATGTAAATVQAERSAGESVRKYVAGLGSPMVNGDTLVVAEASSAYELICGGDRLEFQTGLQDTAFTLLTLPGTAAEFSKADAHTLVVRGVGRALVGGQGRLAAGRGERGRGGDRVQLRDLEAKMTEVDAHGAVTGLELRFREPLDSPRLHFYPPALDEVARGRPTARP
jgi:hypothetical protein